jgi:hypothetical protein
VAQSMGHPSFLDFACLCSPDSDLHSLGPISKSNQV